MFRNNLAEGGLAGEGGQAGDGLGGALAVLGGTSRVTSSTFRYNLAQGGDGGTGGNGFGGAIYVGSGVA